ncbi:MAG TPA: hypothetical protein VEA69_16150 [Tepidisphaeraceae bacterium]|nr:hypothetical protein [Tepidisphaeraceae bacterium]
MMLRTALGLIAWWVVVVVPGRAGACVRGELDALAVQWASVVVEARLVEVSERCEIRAVSVKGPKGADGKRGPDVTAVYWYRLYSFEVVSALDGSAKAKHRVEAIRFFGRADDPNVKGTAGARPVAPVAGAAPCGAVTRGAVGKTFVLLLRPEQDFKMGRPPVWPDAKGDLREKEIHDLKAMTVVHAIAAEDMDAARRADLKKLIAHTRAAERKLPEAELKKHVAEIALSADAERVERAEAAVRAVGYRAVGALKSARDKAEASAEGAGRVLGLIAELSPPSIVLEMGNVEE